MFLLYKYIYIYLIIYLSLNIIQVNSSLFSRIPGIDDQQRLYNLQIGVARARHLWAGSACLNQHFRDPGAVHGATQDVLFLCAWFGGPCTYRLQNNSNNEGLTRDNRFELAQAMQKIHKDPTVFNFNQDEQQEFIDTMARAIASTGSVDNDFVGDAISSMAELEDMIVKDRTGQCKGPHITITCSGNTTQDVNITMGQTVQWTWTTQHAESVSSTTPNWTPRGFGARNQTLARHNLCKPQGGEFPNGGEPCTLQDGVGGNPREARSQEGNFSYSFTFIGIHGKFGYKCGEKEMSTIHNLTSTTGIINVFETSLPEEELPSDDSSNIIDDDDNNDDIDNNNNNNDIEEENNEIDLDNNNNNNNNNNNSLSDSLSTASCLKTYSLFFYYLKN